MVSNKWRIGLTEGGKAYFISLELPPPNTAPFAEYQEEIPYALGKIAESGYQSIPLGWNELIGSQMQRLRKYIDDARDVNVHVLHMTILKWTGERDGFHWVDISGYTSPISYSPISPIASGAMYNNVEITLNNVSIINDPAIF